MLSTLLHDIFQRHADGREICDRIGDILIRGNYIELSKALSFNTIGAQAMQFSVLCKHRHAKGPWFYRTICFSYLWSPDKGWSLVEIKDKAHSDSIPDYKPHVRSLPPDKLLVTLGELAEGKESWAIDISSMLNVETAHA